MQQNEIVFALLLGNIIAVAQAVIILMVARRRISLAIGTVLTLVVIVLAVAVWTYAQQETLFVMACMSLILGLPAAITMIAVLNFLTKRKKQHSRN